MTPVPTSSPVPWGPGDATRVVMLDVVGGATFVGGWVGTANTPGLGRQLGWVSVAIVGLLIAGTGHVLWLLAGRRTVWLRLRELLATYPPQVLSVAADVPATRLTAVVTGPVTVAKGTRYHQPDCLLVRGKPVTAARRRRLRPCEACRPEVAA